MARLKKSLVINYSRIIKNWLSSVSYFRDLAKPTLPLLKLNAASISDLIVPNPDLPVPILP